MTDDARFEDAHERPLRLKALEPDDLPVISALVQDAVFPVTEMSWLPAKRRFAVLLNRFRWEDLPAEERRGTYERVQSLLVVEDVLKVSSQGVDRRDTDLILSLLSLAFTPGEDGAGRLELVLAGDGGIALEVEALEVSLTDVTRPYVAPSGKAPRHPD
ncbi:DUF2948 family protein [Psychromarinibacter sp. C21-152]|uniref:DUF2948 family protein n=1 Tax=Psychromarinibacter sediminicola TaxID=3033385 RepID=A0AAE3NWX1_9RHOB|nr:DUF2948 family protein [Psychromarinibacter sediminicola]MDF0602132.1 DUF2948 family protein [Psychromarinibacter sediminicola]